MNIGEFLKPSRSKIILALLTPYIYMAFLILQALIIGAAIVLPISNPFLFMLMILGGLVESFVCYPFASSVIILWNHYRKKKLAELKNRKTLTMLVLSILIFNPVTIRLLFVLLAILLFFSFMR